LAQIGKGCPDILVSYRNKNHVIELKNKDGKDKVNAAQKKWHIEWRAPVHIVHDAEQALRAIGAINNGERP
jgi:hypothetical protein